MNRLFSSFCTLLTFYSVLFGDLNAQSLQTEGMSYDFGVVEQSAGKIEHEFKLRNVSKKNVVIKNVKEECFCTTPVWETDTISKNSTTTIKVGYRSDLYSGSFKKQVTVYTNLDSFNLEIKGKVIPLTKTQTEKDFPFTFGELRFKKSSFSMKTVYDQFIAKEEFIFYNGSDKTITDIQTEGVPEFISISVPNEISPRSQGILEIEYDPTKFADYGFVSYDFQLLNEKEKKTFTLSANVTPYVPKYTEGTLKEAPIVKIVGGNEFDFGELQSDSLYAFKILVKNAGKTDLNLLQVKPSCNCISVKSVGKGVLKPNETTTVTVNFNTKNREGKTKKRIYFYTNDPLNLALIYTLSGRVNVKEEEEVTEKD